MKTIISILILISSYNTAKSQMQIDETKKSYPVIGFNSGYSLTHKCFNAGLQFGVKADNLYLSGDMIIPLTSNSFAPKIFTINAGWNIRQFQPFISYGYQSIGAESEQYYKGTKNEFMNGFRFGGGLSYYFKSMPLQITAQRQGKENIISISIYKAL